MLNMESVDYRNLNGGGRRNVSRVKQFGTYSTHSSYILAGLFA
jgi:hypothetical protein